MIRRLLLLLLAVSQIAALPVTIEPPTLTVGEPLTVQVTLPDESTGLVGFPDLGPLALLEPPGRHGTTFTLRLLPLRPGHLTLPPLPFQSGQRRSSTAAADLIVEPSPRPDRPHPLRPFPATAATDRPAGLWLPLIAGCAGLLLLLGLLLWRRRPGPVRHASTPADRLALLAAAIRSQQVPNQPEWRRLRQQLERLRFAPVACSDDDIQALAAEFARLRGEPS